jgi:flagellar hook-basal body complex protein FliE
MVAPVANALSAYSNAIQRLNDTPGNSTAHGLGQDFGSMLKTMAHDALDVQKNAEKQTTAAAAGKADLNSVVMAVSEAELTLNTVVSIRDKVIEAYNQILRMPI